MTRHRIFAALTTTAMLAACSAGPESGADEASAPTPEEPVSILRPDVEQPALDAEQVEPLNVTIGFPEGGSELSEEAIAALEDVLGTPQYAGGGPIVLRAHSDSDGTDKANADASQARGLAVAAWLIDKGVAEDRIEVIVFGEQNPIEPNALPDGSPNEAGRAANRRVELLIVAPAGKEAGTGDGETAEAGSAEARD